ncbi:head-tail connector protein [Micromonospora sp. L32]|uniref:head-tail connector protein n=1 Tax=Micromonospora sp. L32 TaxID=3452214 RepID=UPI003F8A9645
MAIGDPYATVAELKARMDVEDAIDDARLSEALEAASREIETWCDRQFNKATVASTRVFRPQTRTIALVDDFHTLTDLAVGVDSSGGGTYAAWGVGAYQLEPLNGVVSGRPGWPYCRIRAVGSYGFPCGPLASVQVTAQWGWAEVPANVREACLIIAAESFKLGDAPFGVAGFGEFGPVRVRMNSLAEQKLLPYQRRIVGR